MQLQDGGGAFGGVQPLRRVAGHGAEDGDLVDVEPVRRALQAAAAPGRAFLGDAVSLVHGPEPPVPCRAVALLAASADPAAVTVAAQGRDAGAGPRPMAARVSATVRRLQPTRTAIRRFEYPSWMARATSARIMNVIRSPPDGRAT